MSLSTTHRELGSCSAVVTKMHFVAKLELTRSLERMSRVRGVHLQGWALFLGCKNVWLFLFCYISAVINLETMIVVTVWWQEHLCLWQPALMRPPSTQNWGRWKRGLENVVRHVVCCYSDCQSSICEFQNVKQSKSLPSAVATKVLARVMRFRLPEIVSHILLKTLKSSRHAGCSDLLRWSLRELPHCYGVCSKNLFFSQARSWDTTTLLYILLLPCSISEAS